VIVKCEHKTKNKISRTFKNGTTHVELRCDDCGVFCGFEAQEKSPEQIAAWIMPFGKYKGKSLSEINQLDSDYLQWCLENMDGKVHSLIEKFLSPI
jgi:uncharacterized protein (DUF3820 family)